MRSRRVMSSTTARRSARMSSQIFAAYLAFDLDGLMGTDSDPSAVVDASGKVREIES